MGPNLDFFSATFSVSLEPGGFLKWRKQWGMEVRLLLLLAGVMGSGGLASPPLGIPCSLLPGLKHGVTHDPLFLLNQILDHSVISFATQFTTQRVYSTRDLLKTLSSMNIARDYHNRIIHRFIEL